MLGYNYGKKADAPDGSFTSLIVAQLWTCGLNNDQTIACWGSGGGSRPPASTFEIITGGTNLAWAGQLGGDGVHLGAFPNQEAEIPRQRARRSIG